MKNFIGEKILITTNQWFYGKDGKQYMGVHGTLKAVHSTPEQLGFTPNRTHTNWTLEIGNMIVMGCQVMYVEQVDEINSGDVHTDIINHSSDEPVKRVTRESQIYIQP